MFVGKVVGTVWSTVKWPGMTGHKLLLVRPYHLADLLLHPQVQAVKPKPNPQLAQRGKQLLCHRSHRHCLRHLPRSRARPWSASICWTPAWAMT
jgi:hypothetical protein